MSNPGFNLKVRAVANGFTVHRTTVPGGKAPETHDDHVAMSAEDIRDLLRCLVSDELERLTP